MSLFALVVCTGVDIQVDTGPDAQKESGTAGEENRKSFSTARSIVPEHSFRNM
jgi:hypothetical protein